MRLIFRLFLLAYFVMPIVAGLLLVQAFTQIRNDVTPIYDAASTSISNASTTLENEVRNLRSSFAPLETAISTIRNALQAVLVFIRDTIYTVIDVVNSINVACSIARAACIPKAFSITLPALVDLSFLETISNQITIISTQVNTVVTTTTTAIDSYATMLTLAVTVFIAWMLLTYLLFFVSLYRGLWR